MPSHAVVLASEVEILAAFFAGVAFIIFYSILAPWWKSSTGTAIVTLDGSISLTFLPSTLHILFGISILAQGWTWFTLTAFGLVPFVIIWRAFIFWNIQQKASKKALSTQVSDLQEG